MRKIPSRRAKLCASLPPCNKTIGIHVKRAPVVSMNLEESQSDGSNWRGKTHRIRMEREQYNNHLEPDRFPGRSVPETLGATRRDDATTHMDDAASQIGDAAPHAEDDTNRTDDPHDDVDDMEMVETTYTDDEFESAWREDSDDSADEDP